MSHFVCTLMTLFVFHGPINPVDDQWKQITSLPDKEGFAGPFVGVSGGSLIVAGGANFPGRKPWEDGKKKWYDSVWRLVSPDGEWAMFGKLPRPLGYGVSVTHKDSLLCIGGSNSNGHFADAFRISTHSGKLQIAPLPSLPITLANSCGALVGDDLYIAGGQESPSSRTTIGRAFRLRVNAQSPRWEEIPSWPGPPRMLAVAASIEKSFWIIGGVDLVASPDGKLERRYLKDVYRFDPATGWDRMPDFPTPIAAAPSPAPTIKGTITILGGDDGTQVTTTHELHQGFSRRAIEWNRSIERWENTGELPFATVTTTPVLWRNAWIVPTGEVFPGIRTPAIWTRAAGP